MFYFHVNVISLDIQSSSACFQSITMPKLCLSFSLMINPSITKFAAFLLTLSSCLFIRNFTFLKSPSLANHSTLDLIIVVLATPPWSTMYCQYASCKAIPPPTETADDKEDFPLLIDEASIIPGGETSSYVSSTCSITSFWVCTTHDSSVI